MNVNKRELAKLLECSLPTVDRLVDRYPDLPVTSRGSNGIEWEFDPEAVIGFLHAKKEAEVKAASERDALFEQLKLPIDELAGDDAQALTPAARAALATARLREHDLALKAGTVVPTEEAREQYRSLLRAVGQFLDMLPAQLGRQFNLPDAAVRGMRGAIDEHRRNFVRERSSELLDDGPGPAMARERARVGA